MEGCGKRLVIKPVAVPQVPANQFLKLPTFDNNEPTGPHDGALLGLLTGDQDLRPTMNAVSQGIVSGEHVVVPFRLALSQLYEFQREHRRSQAAADPASRAASDELPTFGYPDFHEDGLRDD